VRIRRYLEPDREHCLAVFDSNVPEEFSAGERSEYEAYLDGLPGPYWVIEEQWRIIGCGGVALEPDGTTASLCWGMVLRRRQGEGWGGDLLEARLAWVRRETDRRQVVVRTSEGVRGFFERYGFEVDSVVENGIGPGRDCLEMTLDL
jgi:GNAT superfamily N-acetyltransferase